MNLKTDVTEMSGFWNKFSSYSIAQLNEMLEDDDKLNIIIQEMEEVSHCNNFTWVYCRNVYIFQAFCLAFASR